MKKEVISFRENIEPGQVLTISERVKWNGTVNGLRVRFYPGPERSLHVRPYVRHKNQLSEELFTYAGASEPYISGDDDYFKFPVLIPVEYDDEVVVWVENTDSNYVYTLSVDVILLYEREVPE